MWSIIGFHDNSVGVVPSKWYDSGVCAWPKSNLRLCIDQQLSPNSKDFRYLNSRKLGKDTSKFNKCLDYNIIYYIISCIINVPLLWFTYVLFYLKKYI